jgi:hypothetical protein
VSSYHIPVPQPPEFPADREPDEAYARELTRRLRQPEARDEIIERFLELIGSALTDEKGPLGAMQQLLEEAPLLDPHDLYGYARHGNPAAEPLAKAVRQLYGEAHLAVANRLREQMADIAF